MTPAPRHARIAQAPKPWLGRLRGECAFPVEAEGMATRACCNPSGAAPYCPPHAAAMRRPAILSARDFEREIMRFLEQGQ